MEEQLCEMCGLRNRPGATACARCKEPMDEATQISVSPFAQTPSSTQTPTRVVSRAQAETAIDVPLYPSAAEGRDRLPTTRIVDLGVQVPKEARPEPRFGAGGPKRPQATPPEAHDARQSPNPGMPPVRSRTPTEPLTQELQARTPRPARHVLERQPERQPDQARTTLNFINTPQPEAAAQAPGPRASLRSRLNAPGPEAAHTAPAPAPAREQPNPTRIVMPEAQNLSRALLRHHAAALAIDGAVALVVMAASACLMVGLSSHAYPNSRPTAFENFAVWLARSGSQPLRTWFLATVVLSAYGAWGARRGATLGRAVMGLVLVSKEGHPVGWGGALWHGLGCALSIITLGAGSLWAVVDRWHRTWACLLSRTQVVPSHQVVPR